MALAAIAPAPGSPRCPRTCRACRADGRIAAFGTAIEGAAGRVDESTGAMHESVTAIGGASLQLNALFFPIVGLVAFIVALQMAIQARWR